MSACEKYRKHPGSTGAESGLSLIELLVALTLGLIIVAALGQLFVNMSRTNQEMAKTNSQIENARFAMQFLRDDVVHAGFWNGFVPEFDDISLSEPPTDYPTEVPPYVVPDPCRGYASWDDEIKQNLVGIPIEVYTGTGFPGSCDGVIGDVADKVAGTDVLIVRHAHTCAAGAVNCDDDGLNGNRLYFQTSGCADEIDAGDAYALDPNSPPLQDKLCGAGASAPKRKFVQSIYYIRNYANTASDNIPTLVRSEFDLTGTTPTQQLSVALVEGIELFRVELGIDNVSESGATLDPNDFGDAIKWEDEENWEKALNRGDGIPDEYVHCPASRCSILQLTNAVTAKLYILARTTQPTPGYTDTKTYEMGGSGPISAFSDDYKRHVFSTTVRINNVSGRRETP
jgi:type IV pilus assembly protein PilW